MYVKKSTNNLIVYSNLANAYGSFINMIKVTGLLAEIRCMKGLAPHDTIHTVLFTLRAALSLPSRLGLTTTSLLVVSFWEEHKDEHVFLSLSCPPTLWDLQGSGGNENEMKEKKRKKRKWKVMKLRLRFKTFDFATTETLRLADYESPSKRAVMQNP